MTLRTPLALSLLLLAAPAAAQGDPWAAHRIPGAWPNHRYTPSPADWRKLAVYQVMTDRFANGDPRNDKAHGFSTPFDAPGHQHPSEGWRRTIGGDFKGLTEHLDYIKALGFDVVWISAPMLGTEANGYAPVTYGILDSKLGTVAEFRRLIDEAHARGMYVVVDCVANHFANWFQDQNGFNGNGYGVPRYRWPGQREYGAPFGDPLGPNDFHHKGWVNDWNNGFQLEFGELVGLDDLKTETDWVRNYVIEKWSNVIKAFDIDGFRVDAIKHVNVRDMARMTDAWRRVAASLGKTNFYMFGEAYSGSHDGVGHYTGNKANVGTKVMNGMMDYVMFLDGVPWKLFNDRWGLKRWLEGMNNGSYDMGQGPGWSFGNLNLHFADNHDQPRFLSTVGDHGQMVAVTALMTTIEGVGALYYGSEQAFATGGKNGVGAYPAMFDHPFQQGASAGDRFDMTSWLYKQLARLMRARKRIAGGLGFGTQVQDPQHGVFAFTRGGDALVAINGTGGRQTAQLWFGGGSWTDLIGGATVQGDRAAVTLEKYQVAVFVKNGDLASLPPLVESCSPRHASRSGDGAVVIAFDRDMDPASTAAAASIHPDPGGAWTVSGRTLRHTGGTFRAGWQYTVRVSRAAKATNGQALLGFVSRFHSTGAGPRIASPQVSGNLVTLRYAGGSRVSVKGSWRVTAGSDGRYVATPDASWGGGAETPLVQKNGVWELTLELEPGQAYEYGFVVDGAWTNDPLNGEHASSGNDRFTTGTSPVVRGHRVTFVHTGGQRVALKGSWRPTSGAFAVHDPGWGGGAETPLARRNGRWELTVALEPGRTYEYGLVVDGRWTNDPLNGDHAPSGNDRFTTSGVLASPAVAGNQVTLRHVGGRRVAVKGSWRITGGSNGRYTAVHDPAWSGGAETPMVLVDGVWQVSLTFDRPGTLEYGFVVDGAWTPDPSNRDRASNGNDRFQTSGAGPAVAGRAVTLRYRGPARQVQVLGSWRVTGGAGANRTATHDPWWGGGAATPLVQANGEWTLTLTLDPGRTYAYGLLVDGRWVSDPANGRRDANGNAVFDLP